MPLPRSTLVSLDTTPYYHCIGRCVRRAFLCGFDALTGRSFEHRREWIVMRLALLAEVFALDLCAYAVMSNHYHLVLKVNTQQAAHWSDDDVLVRWCRIFQGPTLVQRYLAKVELGSGEKIKVADLAALYRSRLSDLSWFMRCLNEPIARMANDEDNCTGRFWEGHFKSQALLDERALISCMAYVDLNPIRAGMADTPESSDFTSIQQRSTEPLESATKPQTEELSTTIPKLLGFSGRLDDDNGLPFTSDDYLTLVDWSGRAIHPNKRGNIKETLPPILQRLGIQPNYLIRYLSRKEKGFVNVIGTSQAIQRAAILLGKKFLKGMSAADRLFPQIN